MILLQVKSIIGEDASTLQNINTSAEDAAIDTHGDNNPADHAIEIQKCISQRH
jgi:hypothetical protein